MALRRNVARVFLSFGLFTALILTVLPENAAAHGGCYPVATVPWKATNSSGDKAIGFKARYWCGKRHDDVGIRIVPQRFNGQTNTWETFIPRTGPDSYGKRNYEAKQVTLTIYRPCRAGYYRVKISYANAFRGGLVDHSVANYLGTASGRITC